MTQVREHVGTPPPAAGALARTGPRPRVLAGGGASSHCAGVLARALGLPLVTAGGDLLGAALDASPPGAAPLTVVAEAGQVDDRLLLGLLDQVQGALDGDVPWSELPRVTLLTARDVPALSRLVTRTLRSRAPAGGPPGGVLRCSPAGSGTDVDEYLPAAPGGAPPGPAGAGTAHLDHRGLTAALARPHSAVVFESHGWDACSNAGGGVVLCGLGPGGTEQPAGLPGVLGCGRGHHCPRGPHPFSLLHLPSPVLMLATCNGVRLADSVLGADFNLGLNFLDGQGVAYVSSAFANFGNPQASIAFAAAVASGRSLGEATLVANALLHCAGLERTAYVAVGLADHAVTNPADGPEPARPLAGAEPAFETADGCGQLVELVLDDERAVALARAGALAVDATCSRDGTPVEWFARVERDAGGPGGHVLRLFVFRFPEPMGRVRVALLDGRAVRDAALAAVRGLDRWVELWRLAGLDRDQPEESEVLAGHDAVVRRVLARWLPLLSHAGPAAARVREVTALTDRLCAGARDATLDTLLPRLAGPFFITNVLAREYAFAGSAPSTCSNCAAPSVRKRLVHAVHGATRFVEVCPRCGIYSDVVGGGAIERVLVEAPEVVGRGQELAVRVRLAGTLAGPAVVAARVSTHTDARIVPNPERAAWAPGRGAGDPLTFAFRFPPDHVPHHYFIRVLAASDHEIAFGSRVFFVT